MGGVDLLLSVVGSLLLVWLLLVGALLVVSRRTADRPTLREALRLLPDVVRLVRRLAADPAVPRGVRWRLAALLAYLLLPVDLVPDFLPVVGWTDDAVLVVLVLRSVVRTAGPEALTRHWPGSPEGLAVLERLVGLGGQPGVHERHH
jgi:uncharacterized membrane protein YkvA (DUF1232 family)